MSLAPAPRRRSSVALLLGALLAVLTLGLVCGPASAAAAGASGALGTSGAFSAGASGAGAGAGAQTVRVAAPAMSAVGDGVGCGQQKKDESGGQPAAPSRGAFAHEQLVSTLSYAHGGHADWTADGAFLGVTPDRGPPPRDPPTHVELSVLRV
ncbi:hypothetical protein ACFQVC_38855 [Streptomyces monticola]|uniref:Uncharacterized protein n=1 Tax=Streptomyces monticola TaxID=2666263 RepID=A0ABW2JXD8_9ACTN